MTYIEGTEDADFVEKVLDFAYFSVFPVCLSLQAHRYAGRQRRRPERLAQLGERGIKLFRQKTI